MSSDFLKRVLNSLQLWFFRFSEIVYESMSFTAVYVTSNIDFGIIIPELWKIVVIWILIQKLWSLPFWKRLGIVFKFRVLYSFIWIHLYAVKWYSLKRIGSECIFDSLFVRYLRLVVMVKWLSISMVLVISRLCLVL